MRLKHVLIAISVFLSAFTSVQSTAYSQEKESALKGLMIRARGIAVVPQEDASISAIGGDVDIYNAYVPELDFT